MITKPAVMKGRVCLEHIAASVLNPTVAVLTGLSDLNQMWTFHWFGSSEETEHGVVAIKKLVLDDDDLLENGKHHAKYLLEYFAEKPSSPKRAL
jgi:hypothetical protein